MNLKLKKWLESIKNKLKWIKNNFFWLEWIKTKKKE